MSCINVLPNLYLLDSAKLYDLDKIVGEFNIKYIFNLSAKYIEISNSNVRIENYNLMNKINVYDFDNLNNTMGNNFLSNNNCLIISENNFLGFILYCGFIIKNMKLTIIESLNMYKNFNIDFLNIPDIIISDLFDYYNFSTKL